MNVKDLMATPVITTHEDDTLHQAALKMIENKVGCLPVINDEGKLTGILSESNFIAESHSIPFSRDHAPQLFGRWMDRDEIEKMYDEARNVKVKQIMTNNVISLTEDQPIEDLIDKLIKYGFYRYPVVRDGKPVGIVSKRDFLKLLV